MLLAERQNLILEQLNEKGRVYAADLAEELGVSEDTIRRDLNKLDEMKLLRRVHGGALPLQQTIPDYVDRLEISDERKQLLARAALALITPGQTLLIDTGETCRYLARHLPKNMPLTVIASSPVIACELMHHKQINVILLGGQLFKPAVRSVGVSAAKMLEQLHIDMCFIGICALHLKHGATVNYLEEAEIERVIIERSDRVVMLGSSDKLDKMSYHQSAKISDINVLITDNAVDQVLLKQLEASGLDIVCV